MNLLQDALFKRMLQEGWFTTNGVPTLGYRKSDEAQTEICVDIVDQIDALDNEYKGGV